MAWKVEPFGRDCWGNCTGYRVVRYVNGERETHNALFVGNIYEPGSHSAAYVNAQMLCNSLNDQAPRTGGK